MDPLSGKRGLYTSSSGLKIAYLSGIENTGKESHAWNFTKEDVVAVRDSCFASKVSLSDYRGIDILITSPWPEGISEDKVTWLCSLSKLHSLHIFNFRATVPS